MASWLTLYSRPLYVDAAGSRGLPVLGACGLRPGQIGQARSARPATVSVPVLPTPPDPPLPLHVDVVGPVHNGLHRRDEPRRARNQLDARLILMSGPADVLRATFAHHTWATATISWMAGQGRTHWTAAALAGAREAAITDESAVPEAPTCA